MRQVWQTGRSYSVPKRLSRRIAKIMHEDMGPRHTVLPIDTITSPFVHFAKMEAAGGILLLASTVLALVWTSCLPEGGQLSDQNFALNLEPHRKKKTDMSPSLIHSCRLSDWEKWPMPIAAWMFQIA